MTHDPFDTVRVSLLPKVGPNRGRALLRHFGSFASLLKAREFDIVSLGGFSEILARSIISNLRNQDTVDDIERRVDNDREACEKSGIALITYRDKRFPELLRKIYDPPLFLYVKGTLIPEDERSLSIVGTRAPSGYGKQAAAMFAEKLSTMKITIVSGLAIGIDSIAHKAALASHHRTIAVLGSGIHNIYPPSNEKLAETISESGCLLSEFPLTTKPDPTHFPRRNRIISGMTPGTLVIESGIKGGAIFTAQLALDQNREVFAVPGNIYNSRSSGTNYLIKKGSACLVSCVDDILEELPILKSDSLPVADIGRQLTLIEESIINTLSLDPMHIDEISEKASLATHDTLVQLLQLEFAGIVRQLPGKFFILTKM